MQVGVLFPSTEIEPTPEAVRRFTQAVDAMGYDYVFTADHVLGGPHDRTPRLWGPYTEADSFFDPFVLLTFMAAISDRLDLVTSVLVLPQRQTVLVAKQAADLAVLSGNRLRLAAGTGWNYVEYAALAHDFTKRGVRMDQQIDLLRELWSQDLVTAAIGPESVDRAGINPRPTRPIPLWLGGMADPALRRAARVADGFVFAGVIDDVAPAKRRLSELLRDSGRDEADFGTELVLFPPPGPDQKRWTRSRPSFLDGMVDAVAQWQDLGGSHVGVTTHWMNLESVDEHLAYAEKALKIARG